jgi:hypothetical protein
MALAALVLGIIGFFLNFLAIPAIIFGALGLSETNKNPALKGRGMAMAGLVLGVIVLIMWVIIFITVGSAFWWYRRHFMW